MSDKELEIAYRSGQHTLATLAQKLGVDARTIRNRLVALGVPLRSPGRPKGKRVMPRQYQERMERNAKALADGRVKVFSKEEREAYQRELTTPAPRERR